MKCLLARWVLANNFLLARTLPANNSLLAGTPRVFVCQYMACHYSNIIGQYYVYNSSIYWPETMFQP